MEPRPLYRWKSFWLGWLVLAFLGWAWAFSFRTSASIRWGPPVGDSMLQIVVRHGAINIQEVRYSPPHTVIRGFYPSTFPALPSDDWFPKPWKSSHGKGYWWVELSLWSLMLLFLLLWTAFLAWRWRRMRRTAAGFLPHSPGSIA